MLLSRFFFQKRLTVNFRNFHTVLSRFFSKDFVKVTFLQKKLLKSWFHEKSDWLKNHEISTLYSISRNFCLNIVRAQCGNYGNLLSHFFDKIFMKATFLWKKLSKSWFHEIFFTLCHSWKYSVKSIFIHCETKSWFKFQVLFSS